MCISHIGLTCQRGNITICIRNGEPGRRDSIQPLGIRHFIQQLIISCLVGHHMPGQIDLVIFGNITVYWLFKFWCCNLRLCHCGDSLILNISNVSVCSQYPCPLVDLFRLIQHIHGISLIYFCKDRTLDSRLVADCACFLCSHHIFGTKFGNYMDTIGLFPIFVIKCCIFFNKIQRHISIAAVCAKDYIIFTVGRLCHCIVSTSHPDADQLCRKCIQVKVLCRIPVKSGIDILIDGLHIQIYSAVNKFCLVLQQFIIHDHCHTVIIRQTKIFISIHHLFGWRIFII